MIEKREYNSRSGENFNIDIQSSLIPMNANYWGYIARIKHKGWGIHNFKIIITKRIADNEQHSNYILFGDPIAHLNALLEKADEEGVPRYFPDLSTGWAIF